jgi:hypothetical protein
LLLFRFGYGNEIQGESAEMGKPNPLGRSGLVQLIYNTIGSSEEQTQTQTDGLEMVGFVSLDSGFQALGVGSLSSGSESMESETTSEETTDVGSKFVDSIPPAENVAQMARYIVRNSNWSALATISSREPTIGYPSNSIVSVSDGPMDKSTGVPYMYVTPLDISQKDLQVDPRASLTMTLAESDYCHQAALDPEDPRCAHVILTGEFVKIQDGTQEAAFAQEAMFSKHPVMSSWPADHGFFFAKLHISNIIVLDYFGGAKTVAPKDYFKANANY